jgi:hypothetical protein
MHLCHSITTNANDIKTTEKKIPYNLSTQNNIMVLNLMQTNQVNIIWWVNNINNNSKKIWLVLIKVFPQGTRKET